MKVICINDKPAPGPQQGKWILEEGEVYTVLQVVRWGIWDWYELDAQPGHGYPPEHFAPWDGDEAITELMAQPKEEVAYA